MGFMTTLNNKVPKYRNFMRNSTQRSEQKYSVKPRLQFQQRPTFSQLSVSYSPMFSQPCNQIQIPSTSRQPVFQPQLKQNVFSKQNNLSGNHTNKNPGRV